MYVPQQYLISQTSAGLVIPSWFQMRFPLQLCHDIWRLQFGYELQQFGNCHLLLRNGFQDSVLEAMRGLANECYAYIVFDATSYFAVFSN